MSMTSKCIHLQMYALAGHAHVGTCTSAMDLVAWVCKCACHSIANIVPIVVKDSELSVRHYSALVVMILLIKDK